MDLFSTEKKIKALNNSVHDFEEKKWKENLATGVNYGTRFKHYGI